MTSLASSQRLADAFTAKPDANTLNLPINPCPLQKKMILFGIYVTVRKIPMAKVQKVWVW